MWIPPLFEAAKRYFLVAALVEGVFLAVVFLAVEAFFLAVFLGAVFLAVLAFAEDPFLGAAFFTVVFLAGAVSSATTSVTVVDGRKESFQETSTCSI